jgi:hypothetical protein
MTFWTDGRTETDGQFFWWKIRISSDSSNDEARTLTTHTVSGTEILTLTDIDTEDDVDKKLECIQAYEFEDVGNNRYITLITHLLPMLYCATTKQLS